MSELSFTRASRYIPQLPGRGAGRSVVAAVSRLFAKPEVQGAAVSRLPYGDAWLADKSRQIAEKMTRLEREGCGLRLRQKDQQAPCLALARNSHGRGAGAGGDPRQLLAPVDNVLTLAKLLADNVEERLSPRQVDYAQTIYAAATELRSLIDGLMLQTTPVADPSIEADSSADFLGKEPAFGAAGERVVIVDGDARTAAVMLRLVEDNGYQGFVAPRLGALRALLRGSPPDAIILGMKLADADGWAALDVLRHDPATRPIPLCMVSISGGVFRWLQLGDCGLALSSVPSAADAGAKSRRWRDGDITPIESIQEIMSADAPSNAAGAAEPSGLPCIVPDMTRRLSIGYGDGSADTALLQESGSLDVLLEGATRFLHHGGDEATPQAEDGFYARSDSLPARGRVLLIDDDIRHVYAMTGAFEDSGMQVLLAEDGAEALATLAREPGVNIVLLNVAMAGIDAEDLIRHIRRLDGFWTVPIIALTGADDAGGAGGARASRARWIRAGASDDIARPANIEQLLSLVRAHLTMSRSPP